jgi:hypothetical protein
MDLKKFALLDWVQNDLIIMKRISTNDDCSDCMTKQTSRQLFYRHFDYILGKHIPRYVKCFDKQPTQDDTVNKLVQEETMMELFDNSFINVFEKI